MTDAERLSWRHLRDRQFDGLKFVRQERIGRYYGDFVCRERRLIVEVDSGQHADSVADNRRNAGLETLGYRILRYWNNDVLRSIEGVLKALRLELAAAPHPVPLPVIPGSGAGRARERGGDG
jgi:very-short-patch-repair endonuclease